MISRDRARSYADAARRGAPKAVQVADRYHLVANLRDTLQRLLDRKRSSLPTLEETIEAVEPLPCVVPPFPAPSTSPVGAKQEASLAEGEGISSARAEALRQVRRSKRCERYQGVVDLHQQGLSARTIARQVGLSRNTVRKYLAAETFPE